LKLNARRWLLRFTACLRRKPRRELMRCAELSAGLHLVLGPDHTG
jgi:hypothetical protein